LRVERRHFYGRPWAALSLAAPLLTSNQKVLIYTAHINKVIARLYSFTLRSKITDKKIIKSEISQRSEISLDTGLQKLT